MGVYAIRVEAAGGVYIGATRSSISGRFGNHRAELRRGDHFNRRLQAAWFEYGESTFEWIVLEAITEPAKLARAERRWIETYRREGRLTVFNERRRRAGASSRTFYGAVPLAAWSMADDAAEYVTHIEAAALLGIGVASLRRAILKGALPAQAVTPSSTYRWIVRRADLDAYALRWPLRQ
jgi:hypothetical protein